MVEKKTDIEVREQLKSNPTAEKSLTGASSELKKEKSFFDLIKEDIANEIPMFYFSEQDKNKNYVYKNKDLYLQNIDFAENGVWIADLVKNKQLIKVKIICPKGLITQLLKFDLKQQDMLKVRYLGYYMKEGFEFESHHFIAWKYVEFINKWVTTTEYSNL
jgi:hypothetical protein